MRKVLVIALRDYNAAVRTKSFLIGLVILPVMMGGSFLVQLVAGDPTDTRPKHFAVIDRTPGGELFDKLATAARQRNEAQTDDPTAKPTKPEYNLTREEPSAATEEAMLAQRFELSEKVRRRELYGFVEIGPDVCRDPVPDADKPAGDRHVMRYQGSNTLSRDFPRWLSEVVNEAVQDRRSEAAGLSPEAVRSVQRQVPLVVKQLTQRDPTTQEFLDGRDASHMEFLVPIGLVMLMFMMVFVGSTPLLQGIMEEKMGRIAEVLLGSVGPFELMLGKLLGTVAVSLTMAAVYLGAAFWAARHYGFAEYLSAEVLAWFLVYQVLGVLMYGSVFAAIGAACTNAQESQTMMMPVMLLAMLPLFMLIHVVSEPESRLATVVSFFPPATPTVMLVRLAIPPGVPWWQPAAGAAVMLVTTGLCVYAGGRIFRVGILMQGKGARVGEMVRWVFRG